MNNEIRIVIDSCGSYNECNERALGSKQLTLNDYDDWKEIEDELKVQGFVLNGIDEEQVLYGKLSVFIKKSFRKLAVFNIFDKFTI